MPTSESHKTWEVSAVPTSRPAAELGAYWQSKCQGSRIPSRRDIDPMDIPRHLLPNIFMADVIDGGADYRYRLIGTELVAGAGRDSTGALVSELYRDYPRSLDSLRRIFARVRNERIPIFAIGSMFWRPHQAYKLFESANLPLLVDGDTVGIVFGGLWPDPTSTALAPST